MDINLEQLQEERFVQETRKELVIFELRKAVYNITVNITLSMQNVIQTLYSYDYEASSTYEEHLLRLWRNVGYGYVVEGLEYSDPAHSRLLNELYRLFILLPKHQDSLDLPPST